MSVSTVLAEMIGEVPVFMRLDRLMTAMLTQLDPSYKSYVDKKGCLTVRLDRALYGCVESASLWYEHLAGMLTSLSYVKNNYDACVFNRACDDGVYNSKRLLPL